nr:unnamed protein product [Timema genevievae]
MPRPFQDASGPAGGASASFISKPARGWLHPDQLINKEGITYAVRYIGCLEVNTSMKSLDFDTRSQVAKECINRVCEAAGLKTADKRRKVEKRVTRAIGDQPLMDFAGANVNLSISSMGLVLTALESGRVIARHEMPRISFASGGDTDTLDFVAYVAKDMRDWRACFVLECGGGLAQDLHKEAWFHGPVSRHDAEALLTKDGDFLVRESQGSPGQYVLTGMQSGIKKHLLLVDPEGVVRTKDRMFESVSHLINYHCQNELPIISAESALVLRCPVHKSRQL